VYDIEGGKVDQIPWIQGFEGKSLEKFEVSPCGRFLAFLAPNGHIVLVSTKTKQWIGNLKMNGSVNSLSFTPDGESLFSFGSTFRFCSSAFRPAHPDFCWLFFFKGDGEVYKWDLRTQRCMLRFKDEGCVHGYTVSCSPNGQYLSCGFASFLIVLWFFCACFLTSDITLLFLCSGLIPEW